ncbi:MAG: hypothetical protein ACRDGE_05245 [Candidatus Limnocylindria bacterium]
MRALAALAALVAGAAGYLGYRALSIGRPRDPEVQAALERAVAAVDRELAANLELTTMFDQTRQAFVLENGQFATHREVIEAELPRVAPAVVELYLRIPEAESAMERRGPAGTIKDADRHVVEAWEGDARSAQRALRGALAAPAPTLWSRMRSRFPVRLPPR